MLEIYCYTCGDELNEQGGLMFAPPNECNKIEKYHLCKRCWGNTFDLFVRKLREQIWRDFKKEQHERWVKGGCQKL